MVVNTALIFASWTQAWYWNDIKVPAALYIDVGIKNAFSVVREEFTLKKMKGNTRPIKTLSSCYQLGTVLNIHSWSWFSLKILFPSAQGITDLTCIQNSYNPSRKRKASIALTSPEKTHPDFIPLSSQFHACRHDVGWQGQRSALGAPQSSSPPPPVLLIAF